VKIAILVPVAGDTVKAQFSFCLANLMARTATASISLNDVPAKPELKLFMRPSGSVLTNRTRLVEGALGWGADFMLFLDADMTFPSDTLLRMMAPSKPVMVANCARRSRPTAPTATGLDGKFVYSTLQKAEAGELEEVSHSGLAVCFLQVAPVFNALQAKAEADGLQSIFPLFLFEPRPDGRSFAGEDFYFLSKIRAAGLPIFVDHAVSREVEHLHEMGLTHDHIEADRAAT